MTDGSLQDDTAEPGDGGAKAALARIDAALERIERASARPRDHGAKAAQQSAIEESVRGSLAELDALIERLEK